MGLTHIIIWICIAIVAVCVIAMVIERRRHGASKAHTVIFVIAIICLALIGIMNLINGNFS